MKNLIRFSLISPVILLAGTQQLLAADGDWPNWRGPTFDNHAPAGSSVPTEFSETKNVIWKAAVEGRGHSSPIVVGNRVILTAADERRQVQTVIAFELETGRPAWTTELQKDGFAKKIHPKNTHASPTPAWDGERLLVSFHNGGMVKLTALSITGEKLWQTDAGAYQDSYNYGYAASPLLHGKNVIVVGECERSGFLAAFDRASGKEVWRVARAGTTSYSSPIVAKAGGRELVVISGDDKLTAYDPADGRTVWEVPGITKATCGTVVWDGDLIFASGGYPNKETLAVNAKTGQPVWRNGDKSYEQSMLAHDGHLYALNDAGIAICWRASDGEELWKERLGGPVSASPLLVGDTIYASNERGQFFVFKANPAKFELLAKTQLGDSSFASPAVSGDRLFIRTEDSLFCIGER